ncbi:MAG: alpha/beta fold hydrolase [Phenylobacterium sp.]
MTQAPIYHSAEGEALLRAAYAGILKHWPVPHEFLRLPTRQGETFVVASGDPAAPPLVLLHGAGANAFTWMGDVAAWAKHFRVYAVDVIGEPGESAPSRPSRSGPAHAEWLDDVLEGLGVAKADMVGMSLGGWLALDYAIRRLDRVGKLALICPGGIGQVKLSFLVQSLGLLLMAYLTLIFTHFRPNRGELPTFGDAALGQLKGPILMIVGARDTLLDSAESARRLARAAPQAKITVLPDAGHFIAGQTAPILDFLLAAP